MDLIDLFDRGSAWSGAKIPAAVKKLDSPTPCDDWTVQRLIDHMLDTQRYFTETARGTSPEPPAAEPPALLSDDPAAQYERARQELLEAYREPGAIERTGPSLGIAFADQLIHGWDLAAGTGQDATMPSDLAETALSMLDGQLTDDRRGDAFKPEVPVDAGASPQERLLAYVGRKT